MDIFKLYIMRNWIFCNTLIAQKDSWVILPIQQFSQFWYRILRLLLVSWFPPIPPFCRGRFLKKLYLEGSVISACPGTMIKTWVGERQNPWGSMERCILDSNPERLIKTMIGYIPFCLSWPGSWDIFLEKKRKWTGVTKSAEMINST